MDTPSLLAYERMSAGYKSQIDAEWLQAERLVLGLATIFHVLDHGKCLADRVFQD